MKIQDARKACTDSHEILLVAKASAAGFSEAAVAYLDIASAALARAERVLLFEEACQRSGDPTCQQQP